MASYVSSILDYYYALPADALDAKTVRQVGRSFLDYYGCALYTAKHHLSKPLLDLLLDLGAPGESTVFGTKRRSNLASAACANACRVSSIEMDDGSGINAGVHPGLYVWSAALAACEQRPCDTGTLRKAVVFGYDLCMRVGMLSAKNVSRLGLHGPGLSGAFGAVATAGMILGLDRAQMERALGIAGSLLPVCPFISFVKGTDNKDLYGGWGVYIAMMAVTAAMRGLTGPAEILEGEKSLYPLYDGDWGKDAAFGNPYYINVIGFKEFPTCLSVHPALITLEALRKKRNFLPEDVEQMTLTVHPGAYTLNSGATLPLTPTSAKLYLPYCMAVALVKGVLTPADFAEEALGNPVYAALSARVSVEEEPAFSQEHGGPACRIRLQLKDGECLMEETWGIRWCVDGASDEGLTEKFAMLTKDVLPKETCGETARRVLALRAEDLPLYREILGRL